MSKKKTKDFQVSMSRKRATAPLQLLVEWEKEFREKFNDRTSTHDPPLLHYAKLYPDDRTNRQYYQELYARQDPQTRYIFMTRSPLDKDEYFTLRHFSMTNLWVVDEFIATRAKPFPTDMTEYFVENLSVT